MREDSGHDTSFSRRRRWSLGLNAVVGGVALLAIMVMLNYLAARHYWRHTAGSEAAVRLSPMTQRMLQSVTNQVDVTVLFEPDPRDSLYAATVNLLAEYHHINPNVVVEKVDPKRDPARAQTILAQHNISSLGERELVIFAQGERVQVVNSSDLSEWDIDTTKAMTVAASGGTNEFRRKGYRGESLFTGALFAVTDPRDDRAYFLQGHREHSLTGSRHKGSYRAFGELLRAKAVKVQDLQLTGTNTIPADARLLIIAGPTDQLNARELEQVDQFLERGGRLFLLFNASAIQAIKSPQNGLEKILAKWGVKAGNNLVYDREHIVVSNDIRASEFGSHPIMKPLVGSTIHLIQPRSVGRLGASAPSADAAQVTELILSGEKSVTYSGYKDGSFTWNRAEDGKPGRKPLAVAVEKGAIQGLSTTRGATRIVVTGDSEFLKDGSIGSVANQEFARLAIDWLLDRHQLLGGIEPRPVNEYKILLGEQQMFQLRLILLIGLPGTVLLPGFLVWLRRRR